MCSAYVWPRLVQGQGKKLTLLPMLHMGYSSPFVIALVYDFTLLYKTIWFHPVTYGGRHDWFRFRKHPSSLPLFETYKRYGLNINFFRRVCRDKGQIVVWRTTLLLIMGQANFWICMYLLLPLCLDFNFVAEMACDEFNVAVAFWFGVFGCMCLDLAYLWR